ncbi:hypothetical protein HJG60_011391 [Phyllostomus discolor]|nr:hypothetical protein HJG60_011391 [Phyllostomus discolor]
MPSTRVRIKKETRMLGAIQIMTGLICSWLGRLWAYLLLTQFVTFQNWYIPFAATLKYPFWSSVSFIFSGFFTILLEIRRSKSLVSCTIVMNIISACISAIGLLLLLLEFFIFNLHSNSTVWSHESGYLLSQYLFLFIVLELLVTCTVTRWACNVTNRRQ